MYAATLALFPYYFSSFCLDRHFPFPNSDLCFQSAEAGAADLPPAEHSPSFVVPPPFSSRQVICIALFSHLAQSIIFYYILFHSKLQIYARLLFRGLPVPPPLTHDGPLLLPQHIKFRPYPLPSLPPPPKKLSLSSGTSLTSTLRSRPHTRLPSIRRPTFFLFSSFSPPRRAHHTQPMDMCKDYSISLSRSLLIQKACYDSDLTRPSPVLPLPSP